LDRAAKPINISDLKLPSLTSETMETLVFTLIVVGSALATPSKGAEIELALAPTDPTFGQTAKFATQPAGIWQGEVGEGFRSSVETFSTEVGVALGMAAFAKGFSEMSGATKSKLAQYLSKMIPRSGRRQIQHKLAVASIQCVGNVALVMKAFTNHPQSMNTTQAANPKSYRLSFVINTVIGSLMLLLSAVSFIIEAIFPPMRGSLAWCFMFAAVPSQMRGPAPEDHGRGARDRRPRRRPSRGRC